MQSKGNSKQEEDDEEDLSADLHGLPQEQFNAAVRERVDKLLGECAAEGQKEAAANGNGNGAR